MTIGGPCAKAPLLVCAVAALASLSIEAEAQGASTDSGRPTITAGYEFHRDRLRYEFQNPSTFDTSFLVPHRFVQTYAADNHWLIAAVRFRLLSEMMQTELGITPDRSSRGSDFDTFYNPGGDVIVYGYHAIVSMQSLRVGHLVESEMRGLRWHLEYAYRRDRAVFDPEAVRIVTHSNPPSETRTPIDLRETTRSNVQELSIGVSRAFNVAPQWRLSGEGSISPLGRASLTTVLPRKYPGQELVFAGRFGAFAGQLELAQNPTTVAARSGG